MLSNNEQLTPVVTKTTQVVGISPLTVANAAQDTNNLGNVSPVGSTGTEHFTDGSVSESDGNEPQSPVKVLAVTPKKTVLPEDYKSETGSTPYMDWRKADPQPPRELSPPKRSGPYFHAKQVARTFLRGHAALLEVNMDCN